MKKVKAFTLIELLIVVAIIGILAAIAVPNFLEAQVRAKVSRALADMRTMATGIETYLVDYNEYPTTRKIEARYSSDPQLFLSTRLRVLTTPVAYLASMPGEIFPPAGGWNGKTNDGSSSLTFTSFDTYDYFDAKSDYLDYQYWVSVHGSSVTAINYDTDSTRGCAWRLASSGPDLWASFGIIWNPVNILSQHTPVGNAEQGFDYDATNGTISNGDIVFLGPRIREWSPELALTPGHNWWEF